MRGGTGEKALCKVQNQRECVSSSPKRRDGNPCSGSQASCLELRKLQISTARDFFHRCTHDDLAMMLIAGMEGRIDFYEVLGLHRNCLTSDVRSAYKKLAMKWHPDKCSADNSSLAEQSKSRFQAIQEAYTVLSDESQRFLYDLGFYEETQQEQENGSYGMGDFLGEMAALMTQNKPDGESNLQELNELFMKILDTDMPTCGQKKGFTDVGVCSSSKRNWTEEYFQFSEVHASVTDFEGFQATSFCMGVSGDSSSGTQKGKKKGARRQKCDHAEIFSPM